jgi:APA family basic amino acid/polyamine antiporter
MSGSGASGEGIRSRAELVRGLGLWAAISINVANMIGTGVFLKTRVMTCNVGTPLAVMSVWVVGGLLALAGAFAYAEVSAMLPEAGGDYVYLRRAYGRVTAFLFGWMSFAIVRSGSQAALGVSVALFLNVALGGALDAAALELGVVHVTWLTLVAVAAVWGVTLVNLRSVTTSGGTALVLTIMKLAAIVVVAVAGLAYADGHWVHLAMPAGAATCEGVAGSARGGAAGFGAALLGALWAYDGWNNVAPLSGEVRNPGRNLPLAFIGGTVLVGSLYLLVNFGYYHVLTPEQIGSVSRSSSVATEVMQRFIGSRAVTVLALVLMVSSLGALHASVMSGGRIPFAMAREGLFFRGLAAVSPRTRVPARSILAGGALASVYALSGTYDTLTDAAMFASWIFYGLAVATVFVFRRTMPDAPRPYRALGYPWVPMLFLGVTAWLIVNTFFASPRLALFGVLLLAAGLPFFWWWTRAGSTTPG